MKWCELECPASIWRRLLHPFLHLHSPSALLPLAPLSSSPIYIFLFGGKLHELVTEKGCAFFASTTLSQSDVFSVYSLQGKFSVFWATMIASHDSGSWETVFDFLSIIALLPNTRVVLSSGSVQRLVSFNRRLGSETRRSGRRQKTVQRYYSTSTHFQSVCQRRAKFRGMICCVQSVFARSPCFLSYISRSSSSWAIRVCPFPWKFLKSFFFCILFSFCFFLLLRVSFLSSFNSHARTTVSLINDRFMIFLNGRSVQYGTTLIF